MFDPLLSLLAAKAKAVGLVAGTAMVTAALAGGGAVAITAVSHEGTVHDETAVEQPLGGDDATLAEAVVSDSPTVGIDPELPEEGDETKTPPPLPADFVCDETKNHGQNVSAYARSLPKGPGRGEKVSAVAQSDCGKKAGEDEVAQTEAAEEESELGTASTESKPEKPGKADKPAKAQKPAKADKPGKAQGKPAGKGKGGGRG